MEKCKNRLNYLKDLVFFMKNTKLDKQFLDKVQEHQIFKNYKEALQVIILL